MRIWGAIAEGVPKRGTAVLVSIREALGSTPREAGARMIVFADGTFTGTIGGGTLEWRAIAEAQRLMQRNSTAAASGPATVPPTPMSSPAGGPQVRRERGSNPASGLAPALSERPALPADGWIGFPSLAGDDIRSETAAVSTRPSDQGSNDGHTYPDLVTPCTERSYALGPELGQCCGGRVALTFEVIGHQQLPQVIAFAAYEADGQFTVIRRSGGGVISRLIITAFDDAQGEIETFGDVARMLYLFGAGHVGRALVLALAPLPFRVVWVDPRADAFPAAVPGNVRLIRPADPVAVIAQAEPGSFALIMTHSHALDLALCDAALRSPNIVHAGVIGSATKRARFEKRLIEAGLAADAVATLVCPIGAAGPKSKLPAVIAAATAVELLVADENCLKVQQGQVGGKASEVPERLSQAGGTA